MKRFVVGVLLALVASVAMADQLIAVPGHKIMIFGGEDHRTYLGCLSCDSFESDSVLNKFGEHGSAFQTDSIFNHFGDYGSAFSEYGACNQFASDPPVIVDESGNYYGRLTLNQFRDQVKSELLIDWLKGVCGG